MTFEFTLKLKVEFQKIKELKKPKGGVLLITKLQTSCPINIGHIIEIITDKDSLLLEVKDIIHVLPIVTTHTTVIVSLKKLTLSGLEGVHNFNYLIKLGWTSHFFDEQSGNDFKDSLKDILHV